MEFGLGLGVEGDGLAWISAGVFDGECGEGNDQGIIAAGFDCFFKGTADVAPVGCFGGVEVEMERLSNQSIPFGITLAEAAIRVEGVGFLELLIAFDGLVPTKPSGLERASLLEVDRKLLPGGGGYVGVVGDGFDGGERGGWKQAEADLGVLTLFRGYRG